MTPNPVGWFEIYVDDMARAVTFYQKLLSITLEKMNLKPSVLKDFDNMEMFAFPGNMTDYGAGGALCKMKGFKAGNNNSCLIYLVCDDVATITKKVASLGGKVFRDKTPIGESGFIGLIIDSEGNMVGLHSMK